MKNNTLTLNQDNQEQMAGRFQMAIIAGIFLATVALIIHFANGDPAVMAKFIN